MRVGVGVLVRVAVAVAVVVAVGVNDGVGEGAIVGVNVVVGVAVAVAVAVMVGREVGVSVAVELGEVVWVVVGVAVQSAAVMVLFPGHGFPSPVASFLIIGFTTTVSPHAGSTIGYTYSQSELCSLFKRASSGLCTIMSCAEQTDILWI